MTTHCKNTQSVITTLVITISSETACFCFLLLGFKVLIGGLREQITKYILFSGMEWQDWLMDVNGSKDRKQNYNIVSKTQTMAFNHYIFFFFYLKITFQQTSSIKSTINLLIQDICMILIKRWNLIYIEITSKDTWHSSPNNFMLQLHVFGDEENRSPSISVFIGEAITDRWALNHLVEWRVSEVCCSGR